MLVLQVHIESELWTNYTKDDIYNIHAFISLVNKCYFVLFRFSVSACTLDTVKKYL